MHIPGEIFGFSTMMSSVVSKVRGLKPALTGDSRSNQFFAENGRTGADAAFYIMSNRQPVETYSSGRDELSRIEREILKARCRLG
jgi:hypothetical protein